MALMRKKWCSRKALPISTDRIRAPLSPRLRASGGFIIFNPMAPWAGVLHLEPVSWQDGWPLVGADLDHNGIGEPVYVWKKPAVAGSFPIRAPQSDDGFAGPLPGLQWESNHNPVPSAWSLTQRPGWLCLHALQADSFSHALNTITQKIMGARGEVTVRLDPAGFVDGQQARLCAMSSIYTLIGVRRKAGQLFLFFDTGRDTAYQEKPLPGKIAYLRMQLRLKTGENTCSYSVDGKNWQPFGGVFETRFGYWKGTRVGLFSFNTERDGGVAAFDWFHYDYDGPK